MDQQFKSRCVWSCILALVLLAGCQDSGRRPNATVDGSVTLDGELLTSGTVTFHPINSGPVAYGTIRPDGSYTVRIGRGELKDPDAGKIVSGQYVVTVVVASEPDEKVTVGEGGTGPPLPGTRLSPDRYATVKDSPFVVTVRPGENVIPLEMQRELSEEEQPEAQEAGPEDANDTAQEDVAGPGSAAREESTNEDAGSTDQPARSDESESGSDASASGEEPKGPAQPADAPKPPVDQPSNGSEQAVERGEEAPSTEDDANAAVEEVSAEEDPDSEAAVSGEAEP